VHINLINHHFIHIHYRVNRQILSKIFWIFRKWNEKKNFFFTSGSGKIFFSYPSRPIVLCLLIIYNTISCIAHTYSHELVVESLFSHLGFSFKLRFQFVSYISVHRASKKRIFFLWVFSWGASKELSRRAIWI